MRNLYKKGDIVIKLDKKVFSALIIILGIFYGLKMAEVGVTNIFNISKKQRP